MVAEVSHVRGVLCQPLCQPLFWASPRSLPQLFKCPRHVDGLQPGSGRAAPLPPGPAAGDSPRSAPGQGRGNPCWHGGCAGRAPGTLLNPLLKSKSVFQSAGALREPRWLVQKVLLLHCRECSE